MHETKNASNQTEMRKHKENQKASKQTARMSGGKDAKREARKMQESRQKVRKQASRLQEKV